MASAASSAGPLSTSQRHVALGGQSSDAPKQLSEGCRWVGGQAAEIDKRLISQCAECEGGKVMDLNFHYKFLRKIENLEDHAPNLRSLDLSSNNIREMENLAGMMKLRELKLYSCQISRIQGLEKCPSLTILHLEDNEISCLEGLEKLFSLEILNLERNRIPRLGKGLSKASKLKELRLANNHLCSLEGVAGLAALEVLDASHNRIEAISAEHLKGLGKLDELNVAGNSVSRLGFLAASGPIRLSLLDLSSNLLTAASFKGIPCLSQLTELIVKCNLLEAVPPNLVSCCPAIEILDISDNKIEDPKQVEALQAVTSLKELMVQGNPMDSAKEELNQALCILTSMEYIDNRPVTPAAPPMPALEDGPEEDSTFRLTNAPFTPGTPGALALRPGTSASRPGTGSGRPGTASSSRPGTSSGRPGTAQSLKEAGVQQPLMHAKTQLNTRKCASLEQVSQWEQQTMSAFDAIQKQVEKTSLKAEAELREMNRYYQKARDANRRHEEFEARRAAKAPAQDASKAPESPIVVINNKKSSSQVASSPAASEAPTPSRLSSGKSSQRLREAVESYRDDIQIPDKEEDADKATSPPSYPSSPSRAPTSPLVAACDEVEEVEEVAADSEEPEPRLPDAVEVEEENLEPRESSLPPAPEVKLRPPTGDKELRVGVRATIRRSNSRARAGTPTRPSGPYPAPVRAASPATKSGYPAGKAR